MNIVLQSVTNGISTLLTISLRDNYTRHNIDKVTFRNKYLPYLQFLLTSFLIKNLKTKCNLTSKIKKQFFLQFTIQLKQQPYKVSLSLQLYMVQ